MVDAFLFTKSTFSYGFTLKNVAKLRDDDYLIYKYIGCWKGFAPFN